MLLLRNSIADFTTLFGIDESIVLLTVEGYKTIKQRTILNICGVSLDDISKVVSYATFCTATYSTLDIINITIGAIIPQPIEDDISHRRPQSHSKLSIRRAPNVRQKDVRFTEALDCLHCSKVLGSETIRMNTTLHRMVYDRLTRQQQLSIAIASPQNNTARREEKVGEQDGHLSS